MNRRLKEIEGMVGTMKGIELSMDEKMRAVRESEFELK